MHTVDGRQFLSAAAAAAALGALSPGRMRAQQSGLAAPAFHPLPLGAIRPDRWLLRQLRIQADGLTGHLDQFWPDVAQSQWFGGKAEGWERAPYWLPRATTPAGRAPARGHQ